MSDIAITDITNATSTKDGTGTFDLLMDSVTLHLNKQYTGNRIRGAEYANVYLGSMQAVLQQAIAFTLEEQQASKQIELTDRQILEVEERIDLIIAQTAQAYETITSSEANTTRANILNNKQVLKIQGETTLVALQTSELALNGTKERLLKDEQIDLLESQDLEVIAATVRNDSKTASEVALLDQKKISEDAQTVDAVGGMLKAQLDLTVRQKDAFKGKHLNDALKLQLDTWATAYAISDGDIPSLPQFMVDANAVSSLPTLDALITESEDFMDNL